MTREELLQEILKDSGKSILIEAGTGLGKTYLALSKVDKLAPKGNILVVIPRIVNIDTWKEEFKKWGFTKYLKQTKFVTYVSYPKLKGQTFDIQIFDETHHLSERCRKSISLINSNHNILLSATIKKTLRFELNRIFKDLHTYQLTTKEAIDNEILPQPRIILIPLQLQNGVPTLSMWKNPKAPKVVEISYAQWLKGKWTYLKSKNKQLGVKIRCNEVQYYNELNGLIDWCWDRYYKCAVPKQKAIYKQAYLRACGERLTWLSEIKTSYVSSILKQLNNTRTLTFCNGIAQTEKLGKYCINSKNKLSKEYLKMFNNGEINHITACNMLNEGVNLSSCQIGIFANLNSSEIMQVQKIGRILRHQKPIIILPYYQCTREQEILTKMLEQYDNSLISVLTDYTKLIINENLT